MNSEYIPRLLKAGCANLWFASLTKQSFVWRQNYSPKAAKLRFASHTKLTKLCVQKLCFCKYKLCKALANLRVPKQSFGSQTEGGKTSRRRRQTFGLQALQSFALYGGKTPRRRRQNSVQNYVLQAIQSLQSEALYKLCKAFASLTKLCMACTGSVMLQATKRLSFVWMVFNFFIVNKK